MSVTSTVRIPNATRHLKGSDKVAALLLAMGKPVAGRLLKHFDPVELRQITKSASGLGAVPTPVLEALVEEFSSHFSNGLDLLGNAGEAEQLLTGAFPPEQVANLYVGPLDHSPAGMPMSLVDFAKPDFERFPGLRLAFEALRIGHGATTVYNAANEVAVAAFIAGKIRFGAIARLVEATINDWMRSGKLAPLEAADEAIRTPAPVF